MIAVKRATHLARFDWLYGFESERLLCALSGECALRVWPCRGFPGRAEVVRRRGRNTSEGSQPSQIKAKARPSLMPPKAEQA